MTISSGAVLVLDDRPQDRLYLTTLLGYRGLKCFEGHNGEEGLAIAAAHHLDLVISDVLMPKMDGFQFVRQLRRMPGQADLPVIFYTATYHEGEARALADECGVVEILTKPAEPEAILALVDAVLARGRTPIGPISDEPFDRQHAQLTSDKLVEKVRALETSERRLSALVAIGQQLIEERDPASLLKRVCDTMRETTLAKYGMVALFDETGERFTFAQTSGHADDVAARVIAEAIPPPIRKVIDERRAMRGRTPYGRPEYFTWHPAVSAYMLVPLSSRHRVFGVIIVAEKIGAAEFSENDQRFAETLGVQAGLAYESARLIKELEAQAAALREREASTEFALSAASVAIYERDLVTGAIRRSKGFAKLHQVAEDASREEIVAVVDPVDREKLEATVDRAIAECGDFSVEFKAGGPGKPVRYLQVRGHIEAGDDGVPRQLLSVIIDMTERRQLEAQLRQAQKMEAIGQLAGGVAHDFNNLLTVIQGYARFLQESASDDRQRSDATAIVQAGERAAGLTRQLLAFSRNQAREVTLFDLNTLISGLVAMLTRLIGENVRLITTLGDSVGPLRNDAGQIEQVIMNLVVNARDAMPTGGSVRIETSSVVSGGQQWVQLSVSDTGTGMTEETKQRLFEPFYTTKPIGKGTGLGLATVYGIVSESQGLLAVDSTLGQGSTFTILLPVATGEVDVVAPAKTVQSAGTETILLVEDEEAVRFFSTLILERAGYQVRPAANAGEALQIAREHAFDLVVTDVLMPGDTGPDLFRGLSAERPDLRVLYVSGYAQDRVLDVSRLDARAGFLAKPFTAEALTAKVRELLER